MRNMPVEMKVDEFDKRVTLIVLIQMKIVSVIEIAGNLFESPANSTPN